MNLNVLRCSEIAAVSLYSMCYLFQTMTTGVFVETTYTISIMYINANYFYRFCLALIILNNGWVYKGREGTKFH